MIKSMRSGVKLAGIALVVVLAACVPQRKYEDLQKKYDTTVKEKEECAQSLAVLQDSVVYLKNLLDEQATAIAQLNEDTARYGYNNRKLNTLYGQTNAAYDNLLDKVRQLEAQNRMRTQELSNELTDMQRRLEEKEAELKKKEASLGARDAELSNLRQELTLLQKNLETLKIDLDQRELRVNELSRVLNQKDSAVQAIRNMVSKALLGYKDQGLTVEVRNGKVYVSVEDKLLFESGKYTVNSTGRQAILDLAKVLNTQSDINIMVEGHTDNVPYKGGGVIKDNWDLSVMRATEVSRILWKDGKIDPKRVIAAGRGDTQPIASNSTPEGRAKNRRTEIILTPQLGELFKILDMN